jgi:hypothetical protein
MATGTSGRHGRTETSGLTEREIDGIVRDLARILLVTHEAYRESLKEGDERPRSFAQRILTPSKGHRGTPTEDRISVANIAKMVLIGNLCREMRYDERRKIFFSASIVRVLKQTSVSEEDIVRAIRTFLRRYPRPLHTPGFHPPPKDDD